MCKYAFVLALFAVHAAARGAGDDPVQKVVTLLEDMASKIGMDSKEEQEIYDKFACWCEETTQRKATAISEAKTSIETLTNRVLELKGSTASIKANIDDLNRQVSGNYAGQESSKKIRDRQQASYESKRADLESAIGAMEGAIKVLEGAGEFAQVDAELLSLGGTIKKSLVYTEDNKDFSDESRQMVEDFVANPSKYYGHKKFSGIQEKGNFGDYAPGSGAIQGILKGMYDSFTMDLERANVEEAQWQKQYEDIYLLKGDEAKQLADTIASKENALVDDDKELSDKAVERDETQIQMLDDEKFFMQTKKACKTRADQWAERTRLRTEEVAGVNKAIAILTSDDAKDTFGKSNSMLLQTKASSDESQSVERRQNAAFNAVAKVARRRKSIRMSSIAAMIQVSDGHFDHVVASVQKMLDELRKEESADIKMREFCAREEDKAHNEVEDLERDQRNKQGSIERLNAKKKELQEDLAKAREDIEETEQAMAEALSGRNEENESFKAALKDDVDAAGLLASAIDALSSFYRKNKLPLELVQKSVKAPEYSEDAPPEGSDFATKEYKGREGGGIISILKYLKEDTENEILISKKNEGEAQAEFMALRAKGQKVVSALKAKCVSLQKQIAQTDQKAVDEKSDKDNSKSLEEGKEDYIDSLKPKCEWIKNDFDTRKEAREEEMDGLQEAKIQLAGAAAQVAAMQGSLPSAALLEAKGQLRGAAVRPVQ